MAAEIQKLNKGEIMLNNVEEKIIMLRNQPVLF
jgi:hypothetical protein